MMTEPEMVAAFILVHGVTVCQPGTVSKNIKFKIAEDETFAYWELGGWNPGEMPEMRWPAHSGGSAVRDMREWRDIYDTGHALQLADAMKSRHPAMYEL